MVSEPTKKPQGSKDAPLDPTEVFEAEVDRQIGDLVPQKARREIVHRMTALVISETFSGPIAHPRHLREYEAISPGAADRIISMAEARNNHHMMMERSVLDAETRDQKLGMILGAGLFACLIAAGLIVALMYQNVALTGVFLGAAALGGIAIFVKGRNGK